jgi:hypothetical protein
MEVWSVSFFLLWLMYYTKCMCYSNFNFAWIMYIWAFQRQHLLGFVTCNHIGTIVPWYLAWVIDPSIPSRMIAKYGWSAPQFVLGDIILHVMPTLILVSMHSWQAQQVQHAQQQALAFPGVHSLLIHLFWGAIQAPPFDVIRLYIPMSVRMCNFLWLVLVVSHVATMGYLFISPKIG